MLTESLGCWRLVWFVCLYLHFQTVTLAILLLILSEKRQPIATVRLNCQDHYREHSKRSLIDMQCKVESTGAIPRTRPPIPKEVVGMAMLRIRKDMEERLRNAANV